MMRTLLASLLLTSTLVGCANDDEIWMPPSANGKADGATQFVKGSDIPSQYVDDSKYYVSRRRIAALDDVGALDDVMDSLSDRLDGILGSSSRNGWLEAAELVRAESLSTLFPEERDALEALWALLEAPSPDATSVAVPDTDLTVVDLLAQPSSGALPTSLLISSLPSSFQTVAKRVQLAFNADSDSSTIELVDVDNALAAADQFTADDVTLIAAIKVLFTEGPMPAHATAKVPAPGHHSKLTTLGHMKLDLAFDVSIEESRKVGGCYSGECGWSAGLAMDGSQSVTLRVPAASKVIVASLDTGDEQVYEGTDIDLANHLSGDIVLDRYVGGVRKDIAHVAFPPFQPDGRHVPLQDLVDYTLVTTADEPLVKSPFEQTVTSNSYALRSRFGTTYDPSPSVDVSLVDRLATPVSSLTPGRYQVDTSWGPLAIDLYPEGVAIVQAHGQAIALQRMDIDGKRALVATGNLGAFGYVYFWPERNVLQVSSSTYTLTEAKRIR